MNKLSKAVAFTLLITILFSCSNRNMNPVIIPEEGVDNEFKNEEIKTMGSFEFISSYSKDIFFADDNLDKEFKITDFLVEGYNFDQKENICIIYCTPFDKENYISTCETEIGEKFKKSLNGKNIKQLYLDKGYKVIVYLNDPKDIKKLKIFNPEEEFQSSLTSGGLFPSVYEIKDVKDITGTFKGLEDGVLVFVDGKIED